MGDAYPDDWDTRRKKVYKRDDYQCQNCGRFGGPKGSHELHAHHVVPLSQGGSNEYSNLITLDEQCHEAAHGRGVAPTAAVDHTPSVDIVESAKEAKRTWRSAKRILRLFT